jgi:hypothetical protein
MSNHKNLVEIKFMDYMPWSDDELTRGIKVGKHDCMVCGELLTHATVAIVGRAILLDNAALFGICNKCSRRAGNFKAASRVAAQAFCDIALRDGGRVIDLDGIHQTAGHA